LGQFLGASVIAVPGISDPATLEAIACREGLWLVADLHNVQYPYIALDCLEVINAIRDSNRCNYYSVLCEIDQHHAKFPDSRFRHERCFSTHAHNLACSTISLEHCRNVWLVNSPDTSIVPLMIEQ
jgi:hypothetical protein